MEARLKAEKPTSGDLKSGDCLFFTTPPRISVTPTFILFSVKLCTTRSFFHTGTFIIHTWNKVHDIYKAIAINNNFNKYTYIYLLATSYTYDILYTKASSSSNEGKDIKNNKI